MYRSDRTMAAIVVALAALVVVAFALVMRQSSPGYLGDLTPEGAVNDYLLALAERDYPQAYRLLADDLPARPETLDEFVRDVDEQPWTFGTSAESSTTRILSTELTTDASGKDLASVHVERTAFMDRGLLDTSQYSESAVLRLRRTTDGHWRLTGGDRFLHPCWLDSQGCYRRLEAPEKTEDQP